VLTFQSAKSWPPVLLSPSDVSRLTPRGGPVCTCSAPLRSSTSLSSCSSASRRDGCTHEVERTRLLPSWQGTTLPLATSTPPSFDFRSPRSKRASRLTVGTGDSGTSDACSTRLRTDIDSVYVLWFVSFACSSFSPPQALIMQISCWGQLAGNGMITCESSWIRSTVEG